MIKESELRIGNYVMDKVSGEWMIVDEIGENIGAILINRDKYPLPDGWCMEFIPLSDEAFNKLGFSKKTCWGLGDFIIGLDGEDFIYSEFTVIYNGITKVKVKYVHQLQNLHYALTGEELEIKELQES
jgi:hypothetical protein